MADRGPLEAEVNKMMWDAYEGDPDVLEAQIEERDYTFQEVVMMNARTLGAHRHCLLRIAREVDNLTRI